MKKTIVTGVDDYEALSSEGYYVDKTGLIKEIIDARVGSFLFTRPRRFGKSTNLSMLCAFFERTDKDTSYLFKDKKIWKAGEKYRSYQGKFPVINLTLKTIEDKDYQSALKRLSSIINLEFFRHKEVMKNRNFFEDYKEKYIHYLKDDLSEAELAISLKLLCDILSDTYKTKVIVLIDEYDTPIHAGYQNKYYDEIINFMRGFLSNVLKSNHNLLFGILMGILRVAKESLFSGLNNLNVYSVLNNEFSSHFGFTKNEVNELLDYYGLKEKSKEMDEWYDGYRFGDTQIFNPWSIMKYLKEKGDPKPYWVDTGGNEDIGLLLSKASSKEIKDLHSLYLNEDVYTKINTEVRYLNILNDETLLLSFLLVSGYLTTTGERNESKEYKVKIPNKEIFGVYHQEILSGLLKYKGSTSSITEAFLEGNIEEIKKQLATILKKVSSFDTHENFYHGLVIGLLALSENNFFLASNKEQGYGRFDICLTPKDPKRKAIIIELKSQDKRTKEKLKTLAIQGLNQIEQKEYFQGLNPSRCSSVLEYGIAFSKKEVEIVSKEKKLE